MYRTSGLPNTRIDVADALHEHGTFWENAVNNLRYGFELNLRFNVFSGRLTQLLCLFILGMQLGPDLLAPPTLYSSDWVWSSSNIFSVVIGLVIIHADRWKDYGEN